MLRIILEFLFQKSASRIDMLVLMIATALMISKKYVKGLEVLVIGGILTAIVSVVFDL
jgi:hypothetical protein